MGQLLDLCEKYQLLAAKALNVEPKNVGLVNGKLDSYDYNPIEEPEDWAKDIYIFFNKTWLLQTKVKYERDWWSQVTQFNLTQFPGCCGVCVSYHIAVSPSYRKLGIGTIMQNFRIELARMLGYTTLMCTDRIENPAQLKILKKNGWSDIHTFVNKRTMNEVAVSIKEL